MHKLVLAALLAAALVLTACQSVDQRAIEAASYSAETLGDPVEPVGPGGAFEIVARDLYFVKDGVDSRQEDIVIEVSEGTVDITMVNEGQAIHNVRVDEAFGDVKKVEGAGGTTAEGELQLFPGNFAFYCDIPGHRAAGMVGTMVVNPA